MKTFVCDKCKKRLEKSNSVSYLSHWKPFRMAKSIAYDFCEECYRKAIKAIIKFVEDK